MCLKQWRISLDGIACQYERKLGHDRFAVEEYCDAATVDSKNEKRWLRKTKEQ